MNFIINLLFSNNRNSVYSKRMGEAKMLHLHVAAINRRKFSVKLMEVRLA